VVGEQMAAERAADDVAELDHPDSFQAGDWRIPGHVDYFSKQRLIAGRRIFPSATASR
jgi:hypothetical protein